MVLTEHNTWKRQVDVVENNFRSVQLIALYSTLCPKNNIIWSLSLRTKYKMKILLSYVILDVLEALDVFAVRLRTSVGQHDTFRSIIMRTDLACGFVVL